VPGHTLDHIAYFAASPSPVLFCGDTLFAGGCGRLFEGTPAMMHASLQRLAGLPAETAVYCAHEYTQANLAFASAAEPDNAALAARVAEVRERRERDEPTVPSSIALERDTNPFLRPDASGILAGLSAAGQAPAADSVGRFAQLRAWKDSF
jgi:hydroxyacylglutathione hydrolase